MNIALSTRCDITGYHAALSFSYLFRIDNEAKKKADNFEDICELLPSQYLYQFSMLE